MYQQPQCLAPLQVDGDKIGKDSDHNIVLLPPITISNNRKRIKRAVVTRPLPDAGLDMFTQFVCAQSWDEVLKEENIDRKVDKFHTMIRSKLDEFLPEETMMVSCLDKKWMNPALKNLLRKIKREFYKNRTSPKWRKMKKKFKKLKRKTVRNFYFNFVSELKVSNPSKWYSMAKRLGAEKPNSDGELKVECLQGFDNEQSAEKVAEHFSQISKEYSPL